MNEKIKQLALDAGIGFTLWDDSGREMIDNYTPEEYLEKFAELIVQECLTIVDDLVDKQADGSWTSNELYTDYNGALHLAGRQIRQHFGVEL